MLSHGDYRQLFLTNRQYAFSRNFSEQSAIITVNNDDNEFTMTLPAGNASCFTGTLSGKTVNASNGNITVTVPANSGEIWIAGSVDVPTDISACNIPTADVTPAETSPADSAESSSSPEPAAAPAEPHCSNEEFERGKIAGLQEAVLALMSKNGPITDQMRKDVADNVYHDSLINWVKSFR